MQYYYTGWNGYKKLRSPLLLGKIFGKHESTIRRELKRGMLTHKWDNPPLERREYNVEYAQKDTESQWSAKGLELKLGFDWPLVQSVTHLIRNEHYSQYAVLAEFDTTDWPSIKVSGRMPIFSTKTCHLELSERYSEI